MSGRFGSSVMCTHAMRKEARADSLSTHNEQKKSATHKTNPILAAYEDSPARESDQYHDDTHDQLLAAAKRNAGGKLTDEALSKLQHQLKPIGANNENANPAGTTGVVGKQHSLPRSFVLVTPYGLSDEKEEQKQAEAASKSKAIQQDKFGFNGATLLAGAGGTRSSSQRSSGSMASSMGYSHKATLPLPAGGVHAPSSTHSISGDTLSIPESQLSSASAVELQQKIKELEAVLEREKSQREAAEQQLQSVTDGTRQLSSMLSERDVNSSSTLIGGAKKPPLADQSSTLLHNTNTNKKTSEAKAVKKFRQKFLYQPHLLKDVASALKRTEEEHQQQQKLSSSSCASSVPAKQQPFLGKRSPSPGRGGLSSAGKLQEKRRVEFLSTPIRDRPVSASTQQSSTTPSLVSVSYRR